MSRIRTLSMCLGSIALGALGALYYHGYAGPRPGVADATIISQVREVARLQTLEVTLHKKVSYEPSPEPADTVWGDVWHWAQQALQPAHGKVIVFATARLGLDLSKLGPDSMRVDEGTVFLVLPPTQTEVELLPAETEVIGSNLDSAQTTQLLESARQAFLRQVDNDAQLKARARASAARALTGLLLSLGFEHVQIVDRLPVGGFKGSG